MNEMERAATIKDVARLSRVSLATVSRVINGGKGVSPELQDKVLAAVQELGYNPNRAARALAQRKTNSIGIVVNNLHDPFFYDLLRGFEDGAQQTSYNVLFCSVPSNDAAAKEKYVKYLTGGVVDAVILYGSYYSDEPLVHYLRGETTCDHIIIENDIMGVDCNELLIDNIGGAQQAVRYLYDQGHTRIANIYGSPNKKAAIDRMNGYMNEMRASRLEIEPSFVQSTFANYQEGYERMRKLMALPNRPTAVFCSDDAIASYAVRAALDIGLRVPEDVSVLGFDNQTILPDNYRGPAITSIEQPLYTIGLESIQFLTKRLQSTTPLSPLHKVYTTRLVVKDSVAPPPRNILSAKT